MELRLHHLVAIVALMALGGGCSPAAQPPHATVAAEAPEPFFVGLGDQSRGITTSSPLCQRYFDQGRSFLFAFNHDEAIRSFREAAKQDPHAAMAWWGIALAYGPHINNPFVSEEASAEAWQALQRAQSERGSATPTEQALIEALGSRYSNPAPSDRAALDLAYANAMRGVWEKFPNDADVGALFAEAMMDLRPWNQWSTEGTPEPGTLEVLATLDSVQRLNPDHPLALHLAIHALEASKNPERAEAAADRLRNLQPGLGHLVHMPSHIDVRRGRWVDAIVANQKAIKADAAYHAVRPTQGFYGLYMAHNHHMLTFAAMMVGRQDDATQAIDTMTQAIPPEWAEANSALADGFLAMPLEVRVRFGQWDEVLAAPEPAPMFPLARALRHQARAVAYAAKGNTTAARDEQVLFVAAQQALPTQSQFGNNMGSDVLAVAASLLEGEILYREGHHDAAFAALSQAVALQDALRYDEPPSWILSARHSLGAALLDRKQYLEAELVFREDLRHLPGNGWALYGLEQSLRGQGQLAKADQAHAEFEKSWAGSNFKISSPCACLSSPG